MLEILDHLPYPKILYTFLVLFMNKTVVLKTGIHKLLVRVVNREQSDLVQSCLSRPFLAGN